MIVVRLTLFVWGTIYFFNLQKWTSDPDLQIYFYNLARFTNSKIHPNIKTHLDLDLHPNAEFTPNAEISIHMNKLHSKSMQTLE